ncbi:MAG: 6-phosphofructokinase [Bacteroidales bacterium]|nr:6-phosphofructokinase [Bacteroidales bacterium]
MKANKLYEGKILAILSGGGDTPAVNSSIEQIRNKAQILGFTVYGIRYGWKGLLGEGNIVDLTRQRYDGWYGGSFLKSSRTNPFPSKKNPENRVPQILENIKRYKIDYLVTIGGDDTNGAAKKLFETEGIPVIGFPKTIDNDLRTRTFHRFNNKEIEAVLCPGFPTAAETVIQLTHQIRTTAQSHQRIMVVEVMGRDAGWLVSTAAYGLADLILIPEHPINKEMKEKFFEKIKEKYTNNPHKALVIAVSEGTRWYNEKTGETEVVYASTETDEYGHARLGGVSGIIASEITAKLGIDARAQNIGYFARSGKCNNYDRRLTSALADKVMDLLLREEYGKMPVLNQIVPEEDLEEYNVTTIDMGNIGNQPLPLDYYNAEEFQVSEAYLDFLKNIIGREMCKDIHISFPVVKP